MDFNLLELALTRALLLSSMSQGDLLLNPRSVSAISDVFFIIANLKKNNEGLEPIRAGDTEFHRAALSARVILLPLDFYALGSGLFDRDEHDEVIFYSKAIAAAQPGDTMKVISLREFDRAYDTNLIQQFEPLYA